MNGEMRDREKVMRSLETTDTPILAGYNSTTITYDHTWL